MPTEKPEENWCCGGKKNRVETSFTEGQEGANEVRGKMRKRCGGGEGGSGVRSCPLRQC